MTDRKLKIIGDINEENYKIFSEELDELESESNDTIEVELCSEGGNAMDALAFYNRITNSECQINVHGRGLIASAAVLVLAAGYERSVSPDAWVMVHEDECEFENGRVTQLEKYALHMRRMEDQWNTILASCTQAGKKIWETLHKEETYLTPQQCLELGLIEKIV